MPHGRIVRNAPVAARGAKGISDASWALVLHGMIGATTYGTAAAISKDAHYTIAGKTGTAQVFTVAQNAKYNANTVAERLRDHAWFIAFAPADAPRIAICVLVENGGFGASAAAPIARASWTPTCSTDRSRECTVTITAPLQRRPS